jgi:dTDP-glucose 4,6-dehydratase
MSAVTALVTGGAGFIGSALVRRLIDGGARVVNVDKLTYAGSTEALEGALSSPRHRLVQLDVADRAALEAVLREERPTHVYHLAAETHVDRSIADSTPFVATNVVGTHAVLAAARSYWSELTAGPRDEFRLLHVSTDEVYGSLGSSGSFSEESAYDPSSPYAATKAAADHLVRAWHRTFGLPTLVTNSSNNYGPWQFPEKLIPVAILRALRGEPIPVYGQGLQVRDWLHVEDHTRALMEVMAKGRPGETYGVGCQNERTNLSVVQTICDVLDRVVPDRSVASFRERIAFVEDRPGHDFRYAIDSSKIARDIGWQAIEPFERSLEQTVRWYVDHVDWCERIICRARETP